MKTQFESLDRDPLYGGTRNRVAISTGEIEFPIHYYDATAIFTMYRAPLEGVREILGNKPLKPGIVMGDTAMVGVAFYHYRETTIGPYHEIGLAIPVLPTWEATRRLPILDLLRDPCARQMGFYIPSIAVTSTVAHAVGWEVWGYPKFISDIDFQCGEKSLAITLHDPDPQTAVGQSERYPILHFGGDLGWQVPGPAISSLSLSERGDEWVRGVMQARGKTFNHFGNRLRLQVGSSEHTMAQHLRLLRLDGASPLSVGICRHYQARLEAGEVVYQKAR